MNKTITYNMRLTPAEYEKLKQLGLAAWIRKKIKAARVPQRIEGEVA